jgi:hypothetical protein
MHFHLPWPPSCALVNEECLPVEEPWLSRYARPRSLKYLSRSVVPFMVSRSSIGNREIGELRKPFLQRRLSHVPIKQVVFVVDPNEGGAD